jgi:hypothetical protein
MGIKRTISITLEVDVDSFEDVSGLSDEELAQKVYDLVEPERAELAFEMKVAALKIMNGKPYER